MGQPLIHFSFGLTKSGSTLAYELARAALVCAGCDQPRLSTEAVENRRKINFLHHVDAPRADAIRREVAALGHKVVFKTHTRPDPVVVSMLETGEAAAHAIYRDPRDMALSMLDHGARSRAKGRPAFTEFREVSDCLTNIAHQTNSLKAWLSLPNVRPLYYDDLAFDMGPTTALLMEEMGVNAPLEDVIDMATQTRFTQLNKGVRDRHKGEMSPEDSTRIRTIFAGLYDALITNRAALPRDGSPVIPATTDLCDWSLLPVAATTGETT